MKKKLILLVFIPMFSSCFMVLGGTGFSIENNTSDTIFCAYIENAIQKDFDTNNIENYCIVPGKSERAVYMIFANAQELKSINNEYMYKELNVDTVVYVICRKDTFRQNQRLCVVQIYYVSIDDANAIERTNNKKCTVFFPPTEAMKHVKMWPPYGTYDEEGNKIRDY